MVRKRSPRACDCGCGGMTRGGVFLPGHDAKLKRALKKAASLGDAQATAALRERGWAAGGRKQLIEVLEYTLEILERALTRFPPHSDEVRLTCQGIRDVLGMGDEHLGPSPVEQTVRDGIATGALEGVSEPEVKSPEPDESRSGPLGEAEAHAALQRIDEILDTVKREGPTPEVVGRAREKIRDIQNRIDVAVAGAAIDGTLDEKWEREFEESQGQPPVAVVAEVGRVVPLVEEVEAPPEWVEERGKLVPDEVLTEMVEVASSLEVVRRDDVFEGESPLIAEYAHGLGADLVEPVFFNRRGAYPELDPEFTDPGGLFVCDGVSWPSVWHAFEASKAIGPSVKKAIRLCKTVGWVKRKARSMIPYGTWDAAVEMRRIIEARFAGSPTVLVETGDAPLHWESPDELWGYAGGKGADMYGQLLAEVREEIGELAF